jgi:hypothetical protein
VTELLQRNLHLVFSIYGFPSCNIKVHCSSVNNLSVTFSPFMIFLNSVFRSVVIRYCHTCYKEMVLDYFQLKRNRKTTSVLIHYYFYMSEYVVLQCSFNNCIIGGVYFRIITI